MASSLLDQQAATWCTWPEHLSPRQKNHATLPLLGSAGGCKGVLHDVGHDLDEAATVRSCWNGTQLAGGDYSRQERTRRWLLCFAPGMRLKASLVKFVMRWVTTSCCTGSTCRSDMPERHAGKSVTHSEQDCHRHAGRICDITTMLDEACHETDDYQLLHGKWPMEGRAAGRQGFHPPRTGLMLVCLHAYASAEKG